MVLNRLRADVAVTRRRLRRRWLDYQHNRLDVSPALIRDYQVARGSVEYQEPYDKSEPLVSVCVGTYNRATLLTERCLPSILRQSYSNLEILVVGDACTDDTASRIAELGDARIRFENLAVRGPYPDDPGAKWMVAGTAPVNRALELACGDFITHLDDDDEYTTGRIESLVHFMQARRLDLAWHPFYAQLDDGRWWICEATKYEHSQVTTSSVFYHRWFARIPWDPRAYVYQEPGDWNRFRKLRRMKVRSARSPGIYLRHYREGNQGV